MERKISIGTAFIKSYRIILLFFFLNITLTNVFITSNVLAAVTIKVPLHYDYLPGEPHWGKYGSIDTRVFDLLIGEFDISILGKIVPEDRYAYDLIPVGDIQKYLGDAAYTVLSHYGISLKKPSNYQIRIFPLHIEIMSVDPDEDGEKVCNVKFKVELVKTIHDNKTILCEAVVENRGVAEFDINETYGFADLLDRTVHGAIVKIWASQILFVDKPLGRGRIVKKETGTYGFFPNVHTVSEEEGVDTALSVVKGVEKVPLAVTQKQAVSPTDIGIIDRSGTQEAGAITGTYTGSDSVVVEEGKKITIGILPFENATGREKLSVAANEVREILQVTLSRSKTVKVMDREKLSDILREQALGLTGIMSDSTVVTVGNISGVRAMVAGKLTTSGSYYSLNARIINVETSAIVTAVSAKVPDANKIGDAVPELAAKLLHAFTEEKLEINRNTMSYPSVSPVAMGAVTASVEDAWAVDINPACLMKVEQRDASFFISFGKKLKGEIGGVEVETRQPPYEKLGINVALPIGSLFASGFGIEHGYTFPRLEAVVGSNRYDIKEEETVFTVPFAIGISPKLSFGANVKLHLLEYQITNPGFVYKSGNANYVEGKLGLLFKVSERFKAGATFQPESFYMSAKEKSGTSDEYESIKRKTVGEFRFGTAMYPLKWCFFFADLEYEKQPGNEKVQPGFHLGLQLTYTGKPLGIRFMPAYGMIPLYVGYSHEPYDKSRATQAKYFSFGTGYFLNNIYVRWSVRFNVEKEGEKKIVVGLPDNSYATLSDYSLVTPVFLCIGYRF